MFRLKFISVLLFVSTFAFSQTATEANKLFEEGKYEESLAAYESLLKRKPKDALYHYRYARSAYETGDMEKAVAHFLKSGNKYPLKDFYLGKIYFDIYYFEESAVAYESYLTTLTPGDSVYTDIEKKLAQAKIGASLIKRIEDVEVVDSTVVDKKDFLSKMPLSPDLGTIKQQRILLNEGNSTDNIQYTTQRGDRKYFSEYTDGNSDLYTAYKLLDKWNEKNPLNDLNTEYNENYPFLLLDGITLYFASDGENSLGGYDIFITRLNTSDNTFLKPDNIGMPFNSPFNDYMFMLDEFRNVGWFASDRYQPEGKVAIYRFIPNKEKKIVRTEDTDSLINRARITHVSGAIIETDDLHKRVIQSVSDENRIFINDKTSYYDAEDFKSNAARNRYFQVQKLTEEKQTLEAELRQLRGEYARASAQQKQSMKSKILQLEQRLRKLPELIQSQTKQMRNEEISSWKK